MITLRPVDSLEICVLVDNATDILSSPGPSASSELSGHLRRGLRKLGGNCLCCAAHGFSCAVTVQKGLERRTVLFDTGPEPLILMNNVGRLGLDFGTIDAIVLSHGHFDHVGAVLAAISAIRSRSGGASLPIYLHPGMFNRRGYQLPDGAVVILDDVPDVDRLTECGASPFVTTEAVNIFDGLLQVSGEIQRVTPFEQGLPGHVCWRQDNESWEPDPQIIDERFLAINVGGKGLVILTACSHAGAVNVLEHARATHPALPLHAVIGGLHLSGSTETIISPTLEALKKFNLSLIAAGHCTGWRAQAELLQTFGSSVTAPTAVGKTYFS